MPKITLKNNFHDTAITIMVSEAVARADQPMIELACEAQGDPKAARLLKRINRELCGTAGCQCGGQIVKVARPGRPAIAPEARRVIVTARVTPETAAKLRELAAAAGNMGRALDRLLNPA